MRFPASIIACVLCLCCAQAQDDQRLFHPQPPVQAAPVEKAGAPPQDVPGGSVGTVTLSESSRIQAFMADYASRRRPLKGYRVQIFLGDRNQAESARRSFLQQHPDMPAYLSYLAPNFRVRVGDLRDRMEAEALKEKLRAGFPGLYIVPDDIEPPALKNRAAAGETAP